MRQFTVICSKQDYDEVAQILEGWGYEVGLTEWVEGEDCITVCGDEFYPYTNALIDPTEPRYTLEELRGMENPNTETL